MLEIILIVAEQVLLYLPLMIGAYISFSLMKVPNLSLEAAYISGAVFAAKALAFTHYFSFNSLVVLLITGAAALLGGLVVGFVVTCLDVYLKIPHLLASILTISLCYGMNLFLLGGASESLTRFINPLAALPLKLHPELGVLAVVGFALIIIMHFFLSTQLGFCVAVYGNNPSIFESYRISTSFVVSCGLIISTMLAGLAGFFVAQTSGFVDINGGPGLSMFCVTALILGKMICSKRFILSFIVPLTGMTMYATLQQMLLKVGFSAKYFMVLQTIIVVVVLIYKYRGRAARELTGDHLGV